MSPDMPEPASNQTANTSAPTQTISGTDLGTLFGEIAAKIIEQQEAVIGPIAVEQAKQIHELVVNWPQHQVNVEGDPRKAIDDLVQQYKELFGQIAVQVSKEAVANLLAQIPPDKQPKSLQ